jgi:predicted DNA-binding transcriptional regulator AlpA
VSREPERYRTRRELATIMGVSVATIDRMVQAGMPSEVWGARARRFLPSEAVTWARGHHEHGAEVVALER